jgi:hypothetical protein
MDHRGQGYSANLIAPRTFPDMCANRQVIEYDILQREKYGPKPFEPSKPVIQGERLIRALTQEAIAKNVPTYQYAYVMCHPTPLLSQYVYAEEAKGT